VQIATCNYTSQFSHRLSVRNLNSLTFAIVQLALRSCYMKS